MTSLDSEREKKLSMLVRQNYQCGYIAWQLLRSQSKCNTLVLRSGQKDQVTQTQACKIEQWNERAAPVPTEGLVSQK